jgi:hypothetical protein
LSDGVTALFKLAVDSETVRAVRTPPHRHHLPGIKNFHSDSYAEIGTDSLRTRLRAWCTSLRQRPFASPDRLAPRNCDIGAEGLSLRSAKSAPRHVSRTRVGPVVRRSNEENRSVVAEVTSAATTDPSPVAAARLDCAPPFAAIAAIATGKYSRPHALRAKAK